MTQQVAELPGVECVFRIDRWRVLATQGGLVVRRTQDLNGNQGRCRTSDRIDRQENR